ncbi:3'-5' exonuclease [Streptomyces triticirhizae]|uniref:3'-5' exonuclease n=1 Tax=Streptomyces triticirhizae TaxID=2483353 RepID=A0A3M2MAG9_9ACTN|nr:3'-5' exonuclease [Streptomyces triticirhizae]RMI46482.1 3'-5' exonuclease [Streptomyces triticirhizae]
MQTDIPDPLDAPGSPAAPGTGGVSRSPFRSLPAAPAHPLTGHRYVVLDCETTGFEPERGDRMVSLALVTVVDGRVTDRWTSLLDPGRDTGPVHIHGITKAQSTTAPRFVEVLPAILDRLDGAVLVAHNVGFDLRFLVMELELAGAGPVPETSLDTLTLARRYLPELANHRLTTCVASLGLPHRAHRADSDAEVTAALLLELLDRAAADGHTDLDGLAEPSAEVLRRERRRRARCDAETPGLSRAHRGAHEVIAAWRDGVAAWRAALATLQEEGCPEAGRLWGWFGGTLTSPTAAFGRPRPEWAREALRTALNLLLADPETRRDDVAQPVTWLAALDQGAESPDHLLGLFPETAAAIAALPDCGRCWSCVTLGLCATGSAGAALVSHYGADPAWVDELSAALPLLRAAGDLAALGRAARYAGQGMERRGRVAEAMRLWQWAVDEGVRDPVVFNRLSLGHERLGEDRAALTVCERGLSHRRDEGARAVWETLTRRAERCRRRLAGLPVPTVPEPEAPDG